MHYMIATEGNEDGPIFTGPHDEPIWAVYSDDPPGEYWGEWHMRRYGQDLTYQEAEELAELLGLADTAQIGGELR